MMEFETKYGFSRKSSMKEKHGRYIPALSYRWLTSLYDPLIRWTTREYTFKRHLVEQVRIEKGYRVLDLGCGTATLTILLKKAHREAEIVGLDGDERILSIAASKIREAQLDIKLVRGMAFHLPYPDNSFERIVSSLLFHHLTRVDKLRSIREVFRVLPPGGELHVADFGRPSNPLAFVISLLMRTLEQASDNVKGLLPVFLREAGFEKVEETGHYMTVFGTIRLWKAVKPR